MPLLRLLAVGGIATLAAGCGKSLEERYQVALVCERFSDLLADARVQPLLPDDRPDYQRIHALWALELNTTAQKLGIDQIRLLDDRYTATDFFWRSAEQAAEEAAIKYDAYGCAKLP